MTAAGAHAASDEAVVAYVGLGANLDEPRSQVERAVAGLAALPRTRLVACSPLYRNPAVGPGEQPDYVNGVAVIATHLGPHALLDALQDLESRQGRVRGEKRWAPRRIDLDLLVYGNMRIGDERLSVPHPRMRERAFVLKPLADVAPELQVPGLGPVRELLGAVSTGDLEKIAEGWREEPSRCGR